MIMVGVVKWWMDGWICDPWHSTMMKMLLLLTTMLLAILMWWCPDGS